MPEATNRRWVATPGCRISRTLRPVSSGVIVPDYSEVIPNYSLCAMPVHLPIFLDVSVPDERDTIEWVAVS